MKTFRELLISLEACEEDREWVGDKSWEEVYRTCERGDWLAWLFERTNHGDKRLRVLMAGHCANTVRHLMKDERSVRAVDVAIAYGEGRATDEELAAASAAARAAASAAASAAARAAWVASAAASCAAASAAAWAASAAASAAARAASAAARAAWAAWDLETANIVREYAPIEIWNVNKMIEEL